MSQIENRINSGSVNNSFEFLSGIKNNNNAPEIIIEESHW